MTTTLATSCPPRYGTKRSPERLTLGPAVGMVAAMLGKPLMEWQQHVADVVLEIDPETGELAYSEWILTVPRQSGKSTFILAKSTHRAMATKFFGKRQQIVYTAQTRKDARKKWEEDFTPDLEACRQLRGKTVTHKGNGNEHTRFANGSRFGIESTTEKAGHGGTIDEAYIDEAFAQVDNRLEQAFGPAMITRRNKQQGIISTAGWSDASPYLLGKVEMGRRLVEADVRSGTAYFEWSAPDDADPADESVWFDCMPALHRPDCEPSCRLHTIRISAIRAEFDKAKRSNKLADFCRAYLNKWLPKPRDGEETALGDWASCAIELDEIPDVEAIGVAASLDRAFVSIGGAFRLDDRIVVAPMDRREGTTWLAAELLRLQAEYGCPIRIVERGPASNLIEPLIEAGVDVEPVTLESYINACSDITDDVKTQRLAHLSRPVLDDAVLGARWRVLGDRKVFGRKESTEDISVLEAITLAAAALNQDYDVLDSIL